MKYIIVLLLSCYALKLQAQSTDTSKRKIAILPAKFTLVVPYENRKTITWEQKKEVELRVGFAIQTEIYNWYLKNAKKLHFSSEIQDIKITNNQLFSGGLSFDEYLQLSQDSLLKILKTDAIWYCKSESSKIVSGGDEGFISVLGLGSVAGLLSIIAPVTATDMKMGITEAGSNNVLWKNDYHPVATNTYGVDKVLRKLLGVAQTTFPYKKKK